MYRALYRKWRPQRFADVVGQAPIVTALQNQIAAGRIGHAYLFTGTRGTGKTTCAKIFAKAVNCLDHSSPDPCCQCEVCKGIDSGAIMDIIEMDAASNNGVDDIRDLRDEVAYLPSVCRYKVYIIDEVHMLSTQAFNACLLYTSYRASSGKSGQSSSSRSKSQASRRAQRRAETPNLARSILLAGLGLLCVAMVLVPGQNMWKTLRGGLFGIFGVMTYLVGPFLLYLAYLLASGYRVTLFAGKVALMSVLCAGVPVIFSNVSLNDANPWQIIKMLFARGQTSFWEGGVWGAPVGGTLLALFGRPASNVIMLLVFLLGLMFFFAITPADVVLFVNNQYQKLQQARQDRAEEETAYDTQLFAQEQEEEPIENLTAPAQDNRPHHPAYDVIADTGRIPVQPAQPVQPLVQQAAPRCV